MKTTTQLYESFDKAGFLKPASWTPSTGGPTLTAKVRYRGQSQVVGGDGGIRTVDHEIRYPTTAFPGLKEGEIVTVDGADYRVRMKPELLLDGSEARAELARKS